MPKKKKGTTPEVAIGAPGLLDSPKPSLSSSEHLGLTSLTQGRNKPKRLWPVACRLFVWLFFSFFFENM